MFWLDVLFSSVCAVSGATLLLLFVLFLGLAPVPATSAATFLLLCLLLLCYVLLPNVLRSMHFQSMLGVLRAELDILVLFPLKYQI